MKFLYLTALVFASAAVGQVIFSSGLDSRKCMDLAGYSSADGTHIQIWNCTGATNQQWIVNTTAPPSICSQMYPSVCLDIQEPTPEIGAHMVGYDRNPGFITQRFIRTTFGELIELLATGLCVEVPGNDTTNGNQLQLAVCNGDNKGHVWHQSLPLPDDEE